MIWDSAINDVLRVAGTHDYLFLISSTTDAQFSTSAVLKANMSDPSPSYSVVIPPQSVGWYSMIQQFAGSDLLLTGGMYCHHEFRNGQLFQRDMDIAYRDGDLWRVDADNAQYVDDGGNVIHWLTTITLAGVLPHEGMLPVGRLSFGLRLYRFHAMVEGCGHVVEGCPARSARPSLAAKFFHGCFTLRPA